MFPQENTLYKIHIETHTDHKIWTYHEEIIQYWLCESQIPYMKIILQSTQLTILLQTMIFYLILNLFLLIFSLLMYRANIQIQEPLLILWPAKIKSSVRIDVAKEQGIVNSAMFLLYCLHVKSWTGDILTMQGTSLHVSFLDKLNRYMMLTIVIRCR
jgi:hypothetical protein